MTTTTPPKSAPAAREFTNSEVVERLKDSGRRVARLENGRSRDGDLPIVSIPVHSDNVDVICIYAANRLEALAADRERLLGLLERVKEWMGKQGALPEDPVFELFHDIKAALAAEADAGGGEA